MDDITMKEYTNQELLNMYNLPLKSGFYIYKIDTVEKIIYLKNDKKPDKTVLIDLDEELLMEFVKHNWFFSTKGYIKCVRYNDRGYSSMQFHRLVVLDELEKYPIEKRKRIQIDHINRNKIDNRRCNLRLVDNMSNQVNTEASDNSVTGLIGVVPKRDKSFTMRIYLNDSNICEVFHDKWTAGLKHDYYINKLAPENVPYCTNIALGRIPQEILDERGIKTIDDIPNYKPLSLYDRTNNLYYGVVFDKRRGVYRVVIKHGKCMIHPPGMSSFKTAFEAAVAREKWLDEHP